KIDKVDCEETAPATNPSTDTIVDTVPPASPVQLDNGQASSALALYMDIPRLRRGIWGRVSCTLANTGSQDLKSITLSLNEEVETRRLKTIDLKAGGQETLDIAIKVREEGNIPLDVTVVYTDQSGSQNTEVFEFWLDVVE
ncbi:MAG TPA: hypothetical protein DDX29_10830, partial [Clostridiales bacterium]|nr:hypothetical protein [Clostridiales bacterium]